ncbi:hypothetical protein OHB26_38630 [Nocardia sp. NBC_01503]|uniref:hypothetical protein n=1 Tax=Nocardia sp. NBC_01503 TaxID=2975997 RepID=UPI002E7BDE15|nr:hypothetical protein [Nocardia sp. NBC_01503]WTL32696.1 hypothetical protein OHB26_38630 [Nocardia sp. NBC_01503]
MPVNLPAWFVQHFAAARLAPYLVAAHRDGVSAADLYVWNLKIAEAFYAPLHCLEISLRNSLHEQLKLKFGQERWWLVAPLDDHDESKIRKAESDIQRRSAGTPCVDAIVAELSFGFWVSLLSRRYDRRLWVPALHKGFPHYRGPREQLRDNLQAMVLLRNRIMHHEPIHHRHLAADHVKIYVLLGYLGPELPVWLRTIDRVPETLALRPKAGSHA